MFFWTNGVSVVREIDRVPRTRPRFTSGIGKWLLCLPQQQSHMPRPRVPRVPAWKSPRVSMCLWLFLLAGLNVTVTSSFTAPLPCGKSTAITLEFSRSCVGSDTTTASACMTSRMFAAIAARLPDLEARRDFARQIEEQLSRLVFDAVVPLLCSWAYAECRQFNPESLPK